MSTTAQDGRALAQGIRTAMKEATEQGRPFLVAWRPDATRPFSVMEYDAGCGCGPSDLAASERSNA